MRKATKFNVTLITIFWFIIAAIYVNRDQILNDLESWWQWKDWKTNEPTGEMRNGMKNGTWTTTYTNDQIASVENYPNDTLNGPQRYYYPSGQLRIKSTYLNGKEIDSIVWYHENGHFQSREFKDSLGRRQGQLIIYHENGELSQVSNHKDGKFNGEDLTFHVNVKIWHKGTYEMGRKVWTWIELSEKGDTVKVEKF